MMWQTFDTLISAMWCCLRTTRKRREIFARWCRRASAPSAPPAFFSSPSSAHVLGSSKPAKPGGAAVIGRSSSNARPDSLRSSSWSRSSARSSSPSASASSRASSKNGSYSISESFFHTSVGRLSAPLSASTPPSSANFGFVMPAMMRRSSSTYSPTSHVSVQMSTSWNTPSANSSYDIASFLPCASRAQSISAFARAAFLSTGRAVTRKWSL